MESNDRLMIGLISITGLIHIFVGIAATLDTFSSLNIMLLLNGLGFFGLMYLIYFAGMSEERIKQIKILLILYALVTIIGYIVLYFPNDGFEAFLNPMGGISKLVEVLIIILTVMDLNKPQNNQ